MVQHFFEISPKTALILAHDIRWQIMELLAKDQSIYAKRIAETLRLSESKIHYHITQLRDAGLLTPTGVRTIKQGRAKLFKPVANQFLLSLQEKSLKDDMSIFDSIISANFCDREQFEGKIVVGSSEPHGRYDAISRDGYLAGELCWYLGNHLPLGKNRFIPNYVCTDLEYEKRWNKKITNLILIGGHITNTLTAHYNKYMKEKFGVYFIENKIVTEYEDFSLPEHGIIALFKNPDNENYWILVLAGVRSLGTKTAIFSIVSDRSDLVHERAEFITIIRGKSSNGVHINGVTKVISKSGYERSVTI